MKVSILAVLQINDISSLGKAESWQITPDDRQTRIDVIDGTVVQDFGHNTAGDKITVSTTFRSEDFSKIYQLWESRTLVTVTDESGKKISNCRIVIKNWQYVKYYAKQAVKAALEIWRI